MAKSHYLFEDTESSDNDSCPDVRTSSDTDAENSEGDGAKKEAMPFAGDTGGGTENAEAEAMPFPGDTGGGTHDTRVGAKDVAKAVAAETRAATTEKGDGAKEEAMPFAGDTGGGTHNAKEEAMPFAGDTGGGTHDAQVGAKDVAKAVAAETRAATIGKGDGAKEEAMPFAGNTGGGTHNAEEEAMPFAGDTGGGTHDAGVGGKDVAKAVAGETRAATTEKGDGAKEEAMPFPGDTGGGTHDAEAEAMPFAGDTGGGTHDAEAEAMPFAGDTEGGTHDAGVGGKDVAKAVAGETRAATTEKGDGAKEEAMPFAGNTGGGTHNAEAEAMPFVGDTGGGTHDAGDGAIAEATPIAIDTEVDTNDADECPPLRDAMSDSDSDFDIPELWDSEEEDCTGKTDDLNEECPPLRDAMSDSDSESDIPELWDSEEEDCSDVTEVSQEYHRLRTHSATTTEANVPVFSAGSKNEGRRKLRRQPKRPNKKRRRGLHKRQRRALNASKLATLREKSSSSKKAAPKTLCDTSPEYIREPSIFSENRRDSMEYGNKFKELVNGDGLSAPLGDLTPSTYHEQKSRDKDSISASTANIGAGEVAYDHGTSTGDSPNGPSSALHIPSGDSSRGDSSMIPQNMGNCLPADEVVESQAVKGVSSDQTSRISQIGGSPGGDVSGTSSTRGTDEIRSHSGSSPPSESVVSKASPILHAGGEAFGGAIGADGEVAESVEESFKDRNDETLIPLGKLEVVDDEAEAAMDRRSARIALKHLSTSHSPSAASTSPSSWLQSLNPPLATPRSSRASCSSASLPSPRHSTLRLRSLSLSPITPLEERRCRMRSLGTMPTPQRLFGASSRQHEETEMSASSAVRQESRTLTSSSRVGGVQSSPPSNKRVLSSHQTPEHPRKRRRHPENHQATKTHKKSLRGEEHSYVRYVGTQGQKIKQTVVVPPKEDFAFQEGCGCVRTDHYLMFNEADLLREREKFLALNRLDRHKYVFALVRRAAPKRKYVKDEDRKKAPTLRYAFILNSTKTPGGQQRSTEICRGGLAHLFSVHATTLDSYRKSFPRGNAKKQSGRTKILEYRNQITTFLSGLPLHGSHYRYELSPHRRFLDLPGVKSISGLYRAFKRQLQNDFDEKSAVFPTQSPQRKPEFPSYKYFYNIFMEKFNIGFMPESSDRCTDCMTLESRMKAGEDLKSVYLLHRYQHSLCSRKYKADLRDPPPLTLVVSFDLSRVFDSPQLQGGTFYDQQESVYAFGVVDHSTGRTHLPCWSEATARRDTNSINSCLYKVIPKLHEIHKFRHLVAYADNCAGQNKAKYSVFTWLLLLRQLPIETITIRYIFKGNKGFVPDQRFKILRDAAKANGEIGTPAEFFDLFDKMETFDVIRMNSRDFYDFKPTADRFVDFSRCARNTDRHTSDEFSFSNSSTFILKKSDMNSLYYLYTNYPQEPLKKVPMFKGIAIQKLISTVSLATLPLAFPTGRKLPAKKQAALKKFYLKFVNTGASHKHYNNLEFASSGSSSSALTNRAEDHSDAEPDLESITTELKARYRNMFSQSQYRPESFSSWKDDFEVKHENLMEKVDSTKGHPENVPSSSSSEPKLKKVRSKSKPSRKVYKDVSSNDGVAASSSSSTRGSTTTNSTTTNSTTMSTSVRSTSSSSTSSSSTTRIARSSPPSSDTHSQELLSSASVACSPSNPDTASTVTWARVVRCGRAYPKLADGTRVQALFNRKWFMGIISHRFRSNQYYVKCDGDRHPFKAHISNIKTSSA